MESQDLQLMDLWTLCLGGGHNILMDFKYVGGGLSSQYNSTRESSKLTNLIVSELEKKVEIRKLWGDSFPKSAVTIFVYYEEIKRSLNRILR
jgi:hypothetical protein